MAGKPIVASRVDAIPNIIRDGENGLLVEVDDAVGASEAVLRIYREDGLRNRLVAQGIEDVHNKFNARRVSEEHGRLFEESLRNSQNEQIKVEKNIGGMGGLCVVEPVDHGDAVAISWRPIMKKAGIDIYFVQDNQSMSTEGAAHCFLVLSDEAEFCYKVNNFLHPNDEGGLAWNNPEIDIEWPELEEKYKGNVNAESHTLKDGTGLNLSEKNQKWLGLGDTFKF